MSTECARTSALRLLFLLVVAVMWWAVFPSPLSAAEETLTFSTAEKKQLYRKLTQEMRCLKCQNQNLADSPAGIAEDLKREIFLMVEDGKSAAHITDFMVSRYGDFILYKPAIKPLTLVLWIAPFALMLGGLLAILKLSNKRGADAANADSDPVDNPASLERARQLLHNTPYLDGEADTASSADHSSAR